jgi:hypothetical protein
MPMPVDTPIRDLSVSRDTFSIPWMMYLKAIGDDALTANIAYNSRQNQNFKYVVNGCECRCIYYTATPSDKDQVLDLPYTALLAFDINGAVQVPGTTQISIPAGTGYINFTYIVKF